jgi:hypothetical protein
VEETPTVLLVLSRESNLKTCASLVLRLEREAAQWSLKTRRATPPAPHTPGCLLDGSAHSAEIVRSVLRYKKPRFIDQPATVAGSFEAKAYFQTNADLYDTQEALPQLTLLPQQEERMQDPG